MWAIVWKDLRLEVRTGERVSSLLVMAVLIVVVFVAAVGPEHLQRPDLGAALLWVGLVFAGLTSIQRAFTLEQDRNCLDGVLLTPVDTGRLFFAKWLGNVIVLSVVQAVVAPLTLALLGIRYTPTLVGLPLVLLLGIAGFSALGTLFGAVAARTRMREIVLPLLLLPLLVPLLLAAVSVTGALLAGQIWTGVWLRVLIAFDVVFIVSGWLTFGFVVRE